MTNRGREDCAQHARLGEARKIPDVTKPRILRPLLLEEIWRERRLRTEVVVDVSTIKAECNTRFDRVLSWVCVCSACRAAG